MEGIDHGEDGGDTVRFAKVINGDLVGMPEVCDGFIGKAHLFGGL